MLWFQFSLSAGVIILAGSVLTEYADALSDRLKLGRVWIGVALLGFVTSLPEAVASLTAVVSLHAPDLAVGNMIGSNLFNPTLLVVMDVLYRQGSVTDAMPWSQTHVMGAVYAMGLTLAAMLGVLCAGQSYWPSVGRMGFGGIVIIVGYVLGMRHLAGLGGGREHATPSPSGALVPAERSLGAIVAVLLGSGLVVVASGIFLTRAADGIAAATGLGETFVGSIFLAMATSLPEMVVTVSAVRIGGLDLAFGNIFGSNMANMFLISLCDVFSPAGPILAGVSKTHVLTGAGSIVLTLIALAGIRQKPKAVRLGLGWDSWLMLVVFFVVTVALYGLR